MQANTVQNDESKELKLGTPGVDPSLFEVTSNDLSFAILNEPESHVANRHQKNQDLSSQIKLYVNEFEQHPSYKYFIYKEGPEPEMVYMSHCVVCSESMLPASAVTDCRGVDYLTLGICPQCGFLQHTKRPPKSWYADFYRKQWDPNGQSAAQWPATIEPSKKIISRTYNFCKPGSKVLEIGSGWGTNLLTFKQFGYHAVGIEATAHRSQFIRERLGIECLTGEAEEAPIGLAPFEKESFDLIFSTNVLEHVYNTRQVIEHVYTLLKPNGLAYLDVPIYYQENLTLNTHGISHTCNFSHANFLYLLQTIGFDLVRDFSSDVHACMLVRKAPPLSEEQKKSKLKWMQSYLPHRALAFLIEKNGLGFLLNNPQRNYGCQLEWHLTLHGKTSCFFKFQYDILKSSLESLNHVVKIIRDREPLGNIKELLPIQYVYPFEGTPIWYY